jgi:hypothetical protein
MNKIDTSDFKRLIGTWKTSGQVTSENQTLRLSGRDTYEFILQGNYILHKAAVMMGEEKSETFEVIGLDSATGLADLNYFNAKGESGKMTGEISGDDLSIHGDGIKFMGSFNNESTTITGKWFIQEKEKKWKEFISLKLEKET